MMINDTAAYGTPSETPYDTGSGSTAPYDTDTGSTAPYHTGTGGTAKVELRKTLPHRENPPQTHIPPHTVPFHAPDPAGMTASGQDMPDMTPSPGGVPDMTPSHDESPLPPPLESPVPPHGKSPSPKPHSIFIARDPQADIFPQGDPAETQIPPDSPDADILPKKDVPRSLLTGADIFPETKTVLDSESVFPPAPDAVRNASVPENSPAVSPKPYSVFIARDPQADISPQTDISPYTPDAAGNTDVFPNAPDTSPEAGLSPMSDEELTRHTAELWQYHPVPLDQPEPFCEYSSAQPDFPGGQILAARVRGKKHKHEGSNCDDWFEVRTAGSAAVIAVSDGAGSKPFSRIGARDSCRAASGFLVQGLAGFFTANPGWKGILRAGSQNPAYAQTCAELAGLVQKAVEKAREAVGAAYYTRAADPLYTEYLKRPPDEKDFSATLLLAVLLPLSEPADGRKQQLIVTCQVGDGIMAALDTAARTPEVKLLGTPDSGTFTGETEFLTSRRASLPDALKSRTRIYRGAADLVFVMTDGVADDYYPAQTQMIRLYFDLLLNAVLPPEDAPSGMAAQSPDTAQLPEYFAQSMPTASVQRTATWAEVERIRNALKGKNLKLPAPVTFPWINDRTKPVSLQYTRRLCSLWGLTLEDLWRDPAALLLCRTPPGVPGEKDAKYSEMLLRWLDNYVERGSFDDRTLVVVRM